MIAPSFLGMIRCSATRDGEDDESGKGSVSILGFDDNAVKRVFTLSSGISCTTQSLSFWDGRQGLMRSGGGVRLSFYSPRWRHHGTLGNAVASIGSFWNRMERSGRLWRPPWACQRSKRSRSSHLEQSIAADADRSYLREGELI